MPAPKAELSVKPTLAGAIITLRWLKAALLASILVPVLLFVASAWDERSQLLRGAENEARANVAVLREHVLKTIETDDLLLREIDHQIQGKSWDEIKSSAAALSADIGALHAGMPQVSLLAVTDADGLIQAGTPPHGTNQRMSIAHQELWSAQRDADQGTFFSRAYIGRQTGTLNFGISRRRSTPDGKFDGTIHVAVAATYFANFWSEFITGKENAAIALIRTDGEVLARFPETGRPLQIAARRLGGMLSRFAAEPQGGTYRITSLTDGVDRIFAYARIGNFPLVVRYGLSVHAVLAPLRLHLVVLGTFGAVAAGAVVLALLTVMRQVHQIIAEQNHRAEIEEAARKGQRMELLGQVSAGTAHDLANILQAMQMGATLIARRAGEPERVSLLARRLEEDAERGASLTRRLLDLVRRNHGVGAVGEIDPNGIINPAEAIAGVANLLSRILGSAHQLRSEVAAEEATTLIRANRTDFEVAVMNLAVNARDAMPDGGEVVIRAGSQQISHSDRGVSGRSGPPSEPGLYIRVSVIDSGVGMTPDVLARAGERFFTTKPAGHGTGLGLAGAREFAESLGGKLSIETEVGRGTTVSLWLPAVTSSLTPKPKEAASVG